MSGLRNDTPTVSHIAKPIWDGRPHHVDYPPWLYSRARAGRDFITTWAGKARMP